MPKQLCDLFYRECLYTSVGLFYTVDKARCECVSECVETFVLHPDRIEDTIEPVSHIARVCKVAVLVRY